MSIFSYVGAGKLLRKYKPRVDNMVFRLHYRFTTLLFIISSMLVTAKEFVGVPIQCEGKNKEIKGELLNTYCYIMSTFSMPTEWNKTIGETTAYPGFGTPNHDSEVVYHSYYLWVPFMLFFQGVLFYVPHFIWKKIEGGIFLTVTGGISSMSIDNAKMEEKNKIITKYMVDYLHKHQFWALGFFVCEALNLVNVVGNIYFTNYFLGGTFLTYGTDVINFSEMDPENRVDPMTRIFPKMAKCTFRKYGASGTLETHDAFCLLAVNIINEKIYIFIWFWLVILTAVTSVWLVYRLATIISPHMRNKLLELRGRAAGSDSIKLITKNCNLGDWFLVYQLGRHMEPYVYGEFLKEFGKELENNVATLERKPMLSS